MMLLNGIPPGQIVTKFATSNKDYDLDFVNTDSNSDSYHLSLYLRRYKQDGTVRYKIKLLIASGILAYPALEMIWSFEDDESELASRVYHRICNEVDDVKSDFDRSMAPVSVVASKVREAVKPISVNHQEKTNILSLDEAKREPGVGDWRYSLYGNRYPNMSREEKQHIRKFEGQQLDIVPKRVAYPSRSDALQRDASRDTKGN